MPSRSINLGKDQWRKARELAERSGMSAEEVANRAVDEYYETRRAEDNGARPFKSLRQALEETGSLGALRDAPSDLSTNPEYMKGFGEGRGE